MTPEADSLPPPAPAEPIPSASGPPKKRRKKSAAVSLPEETERLLDEWLLLCRGSTEVLLLVFPVACLSRMAGFTHVVILSYLWETWAIHAWYGLCGRSARRC